MHAMASKKRRPTLDHGARKEEEEDAAHRCTLDAEVVSWGGRFHVPLLALTTDAVQRCLSDLTFVPNKEQAEARAQWARRTGGAAYMRKPPPSFPAYQTSASMLSVPAWYGYERWGACRRDRTSAGAAMPAAALVLNDDWVVRDSRYYPQKAAMAAVLGFWRRFEGAGAAGCTLVMPCGSGKTRTCLWTVLHAGRRAVMLVHQVKIMNQTVRAMAELAPACRVGIVHQSTLQTDPAKYDFVIMMIQTLDSMVKRKGAAAVAAALQLNAFGVLCGDEAHNYATRTFLNVLYLFNCRLRLFLTATPDRDDGLVRELEWVTGPIVFRSPQRMGYIHVAAVRVAHARPVLRARGAVDRVGMVSAVCECETRNRWLVDMLLELLRRGRTVWVCTLRALSQITPLMRMLAERLDAMGEADREAALWRHSAATTDPQCPAEPPLVSAAMSGGKAADYAQLSGLHRGFNAYASGGSARGGKKAAAEARARYSRVLFGYETQFCDGWDMPWLDTLLRAGSFKTENKTVQGCSRATRVHASGVKRFPLVIDCAEAVPGWGAMVTTQCACLTSLRTQLGAGVSRHYMRTDYGATPVAGLCDAIALSCAETASVYERRQTEEEA